MIFPELHNPRLNKFREDFSETHLWFACYASVPVIISVDLLYKLWLNFNLYADPETKELKKIPYIAVSDLVLSQFCEPIGYKTFRINEEIRTELQKMLPPEIKKQIGFFLKEYIARFFGSLESNVRSIHNLKAESILNPESLQETLKEKINSKNESDYNKANFVSLFLKESETENHDTNFITLVADEKDSPDSIRMPLGGIIESKLQPRPGSQINEVPSNTTIDDAIEIVRNCIREINPVLDLGDCGLTDGDFKEGSLLLKELAECTHIHTFILSTGWTNIDIENNVTYYTQNDIAEENMLSSLPAVKFPGLRKLICRDLGLTNQAADVIAGYTSLEYLDISWNKISDATNIAQLTKLKVLGIGGNLIENLAPLSGLTSLGHLYFNHNKVKDISPLSGLREMKKIYFQENQVNDLTPLRNMEQLEEIWCRHNLIANVEPLAGLQKLKKIGAAHNNISDMSPFIKLPMLRVLDLSANLVKNVPPAFRLFDISLLWDKRKPHSIKEGVFLAGNPLEYPPVHVVKKGKNAINKFFERKFLTRSEVYNYFRTDRTRHNNEIPLDALLIFSTEKQQTWILFSSLRVFFFLDNLGAARSEFRSGSLLQKATGINARVNQPNLSASVQIGDGDRWYYSQELFPTSNQLVNAIESKISKIVSLEKYFKGSVKRNIPDEIIMKGLDAIEEYLTVLEPETGYLHFNIGFIGPAATGKTTLVQQLTSGRIESLTQTTSGINQTKIQLVSLSDIEINLIDYGGQAIYTSALDVFLKPLSIIVLVLSEALTRDFDYWLNFIDVCAPSKAVFVVINKSDVKYQGDIDQKTLMERYPFVKGVYKTACITGEGIDDFKKELLQSIYSIEEASYPQSWRLARNQLSESGKGFFTNDEYNAICEKAGLQSEEEKNALAQVLRNRGEYLNISGNETGKTLLADVYWIFNGMSIFLNNTLIANNNGRLQYDQIDNLFEQNKSFLQYGRTIRLFLLDLLISYDLCCKESEYVYMFPDQLPATQPQVTLNDPILRVSFSYSFLPRSIVTAIIGRYSSEAVENTAWRDGIMLRSKNHTAVALITASSEANNITFQVSGSQRREYFADLKAVLKTLNDRFKQLKAVEQLGVSRNGAHVYFIYDMLLHLKQSGETVVKDVVYDESYNIDELLRTVDPAQQNEVYLSASLLDVEIVSEIAQVLSQKGIHVLKDIQQPLGADAEDFFKKSMLGTKVFVCCISKNYINSLWSMKELEAAVGIRKENAQFKIFPLIIDDSPFEILPADIKDILCLRYSPEAIDNLANAIANQINSPDNNKRREGLTTTQVAVISAPELRQEYQQLELFIQKLNRVLIFYGSVIVLNYIESTRTKDPNESQMDFLVALFYSSNKKYSDAQVENVLKRHKTIHNNGVLRFLKNTKPGITFNDEFVEIIPYSQYEKLGQYIRHYRAMNEVKTKFSEVLWTVLDLKTNVFEGEVKRLARSYETLRQTMKVGDERTGLMTSIADEMREKAEAILPHLGALTQSNVPGERLAAVIALQEYPNIAFLHWLAERIGDSEKYFIGWNAVHALTAAVQIYHKLEKRLVENALSAAEDNLRKSVDPDPNQVWQLRAARELFDSFKYVLESLAEEYEKLRKTMKYGNERTSKMAKLVKEMRKHSAEILSRFSEFSNSDSAGERLLVVAALVEIPQAEHLQWLSQRVADAESNFIGYQASAALLEAAKKLGAEHRIKLIEALEPALKNATKAEFKDQNQMKTLDDAWSLIMGLGETADAESSGSVKKIIKMQKEIGASPTFTREMRTEMLDIATNKMKAGQALQSKKHVDNQDPNTKQWGGKQISNGKQLIARVEQVETDRFRVEIILLSLEGEEKLPNGSVALFSLHPTFKNPYCFGVAVNGVISFSLSVWGSFTVGVLCHDNTELELNLADLPGVPSSFKGR